MGFGFLYSSCEISIPQLEALLPLPEGDLPHLLVETEEPLLPEEGDPPDPLGPGRGHRLTHRSRRHDLNEWNDWHEKEACFDNFVRLSGHRH